MNLSISEIQQYGTEMLKTVVGILEEHQLPYILFYGSMLGAVRHRGPIPWDYDIDIAIPEASMDAFLRSMKADLPDKYWVDFRAPGMMKLSMPRIGLAGYSSVMLHIDVYRVVGFPKQEWRQRLFNKYSRLQKSIRCAKVYQYTGKKLKKARIIRALTCLHSADHYALKYDKACKHYDYDRAEYIGFNAGYHFETLVYTKELFDTKLVPYADFQVRIPKNSDQVLKRLYGDYMKYPSEESREKALNAVYHVEELQQNDLDWRKNLG